MKRKAYLAALAAFSTAAVVGTAVAAKSSGNDALAILNAGISLQQAVSAAEQHVGGKASRAEYERHKGQGVFEVEVVNGTSVTDVKVDAGNGKVIEATADTVDHDGDGDHED
ncbi:PepSY domain-containing protein [Thiobacillus sedimenti]|uniref:PepSY domain-containing protein n=1 Tax=Thiobacillus sedimenti TaxID=3110231 RepID=A0ABZ1CP42_9PROT|nr:PepSY domain-containing protein [Thiobacillus sp. SCUT-2]WRS40616.1 PepSY domain-containing protein [Thiobacillus sp. SCUT-2]